RWILPGHPEPLNPWTATSSAAWTILEHVYEPLWALSPDTGEPVPRLAESWTVHPVHDEEGEERTRITFRLRDGLWWHDGTPVSAEDVAFTFRQAMEGRMASAKGLEPLTSVETDGEREVSLLFDGRSYWHFYATDLPIVPRHLWQDGSDVEQTDAHGEEADINVGDADADPSLHPDDPHLTLLVGTGPFVFAGKTEDGAYRLVPYEDYQAPGPFIPWTEHGDRAPIPGDDGVVPGDDPPGGFDSGGAEGHDDAAAGSHEEDGFYGGGGVHEDTGSPEHE